MLVPWAIFTFAYTIARYLFELNGFLNEKLIVGHSLQHVILSAYGSVYASQMYFLFSLFLLRLCSPILKRIVFIKSSSMMLLLFLVTYGVYRAILTGRVPVVVENRKAYPFGGQEPGPGEGHNRGGIRL